MTNSKEPALIVDLCEVLRPLLLCEEADTAYINRANVSPPNASAYLMRGLRAWANYVATGDTWPLLNVMNTVLFSVHMTTENRRDAVLFLEARGHKLGHLCFVTDASSAEGAMRSAISAEPDKREEMHTAAKLVSELILRRAKLHQEGIVK